MNNFRLKTRQDIEDFLTGCAFYGTGGGGDTKVGRMCLNKCLEQGMDITLMDPANVDDEAIFCSAFFMGSIAPATDEVLADMKKNGYNELKYELEDILIGAVRNLEAYIGKKIDGLIVAEPGGSNTACCMAAAYKMGLPVLNGDPNGRAIPETVQGSHAIKGYNGLPAVYFDGWGNCSITTDAFAYHAMERIGKYMSQASYGVMGEAAYVMTGKEAKEILIPYSLSKVLEVGRAINQSIARGEDPLSAAAKASGGKVVGKGALHSISTENHEGYYWGSYYIKGMDAYEGNEYKIWFKNENHILWVNGIPHTTSPDLITIVNYETGTPVLNSYLKEGDPVGIIINPSHELYMCDRAIEVFGPRAFGFDFDYVPYDRANAV